MTEARSKISLLETKLSEKPMVCIYVNDELDMTDMTSFDQRNLVDETRSNKARKNPIQFEEFLVDGYVSEEDVPISRLTRSNSKGSSAKTGKFENITAEVHVGSQIEIPIEKTTPKRISKGRKSIENFFDEESNIIPEVHAGDLVFAKLKGYPAWPSRIICKTDVKGREHYEVFCYGTHEVALVKRDELFPYDKNSGFGKVKKRRRGFAEALDEIENNPSIMTIDMLTAHREELADTGKIFNQEWEPEDNTTAEIMGKAMTKRLKDMSSTANDILALLKADKSCWKNQIDQLKERIETLKNENQTNITELKKKDEEMAKNEKKGLKEKLFQLIDEHVEISPGTYKLLEDENKQLRNEIEGLKSENQNQTDEISELNRDLVSSNTILQDKEQQFQQKLDEAMEKIRNLETEKKTIEHKYKVLKMNAFRVVKKAQSLNKSIGSLEETRDYAVKEELVELDEDDSGFIF